MNSQTLTALRSLNRAFYDEQASSFSDTRDHAWPGWERVIQLATDAHRSRSGAGAGPGETRPSILDLGCGNGRFLRFLRERSVPFERYVGCDASESLLEIARSNLGVDGCEFRAVDLFDEAGPSWPEGPFDWILVFGLTHHVPSFHRRASLIREAAQRLSPGGLLALSFWQFGSSSERFEKRILSWDEFNSRTEARIDEAQLEPGDHLLRWGALDGPVRYCHFSSPEEVDDLLRGLGLTEVDRFESDGRSQSLNHYRILCRRDE